MIRQTVAALALAGLTVSVAHAAQLTIEEIDADARQTSRISARTSRSRCACRTGSRATVRASRSCP